MILKVSQIEVSYGHSQALFGVDLNIKTGEFVALMGRNGMGKSTTIKAICRLMDISKGEIKFNGNNTSKMRSYQVAQAGIGLVPEGRRCFANLTVRENLIATARPGVWDYEKAMDLFPKLAERSNQMANTLSGGEQQMLTIGRALLTNPKLIILDEATEGLAPVIRQEIWVALRKLKDEGQSLLVVDKTLSELQPLADHCTILEKGASVWNGKPSELSDEIRDKYLGV